MSRIVITIFYALYSQCGQSQDSANVFKNFFIDDLLILIPRSQILLLIYFAVENT